MRIEHLFEGPTANAGQVSSAVDEIAEFMFDDSVEIFLNAFRFFKRLEEDPTLERSSTNVDRFFNMYDYIISLDGNYEELDPNINFDKLQPKSYWKTLIYKAIARTGLNTSQTIEQIQKDDTKFKKHLIDLIKEYVKINFFQRKYD